MVTYDALKTAFPVFANTGTYPQATVEFWLQQAYNLLSESVYGKSFDLAVMLWTAHHLIIEGRSSQEAAGGGAGGSVSGPTSSRSVGPVSKSFDLGSVMEKDAGYYNSTTYGQRYWTLMQSFSLGPRYIPGPVRRMSVYPRWR